MAANQALDWGMVRVGVQQIHEGRLERDFKRFELSRDIAPGESFELDLEASSLAGGEAVRIDLVIEGVCWFADRGSRTLLVKLAP